MKINTLQTSRRKARIEIIPLIDIMFFLLATFVLVSFSMTENKGLHVNLPTSKTTDGATPTNSKSNQVTISILESGVFALEKEQMDFNQLQTELKKRNLGSNTKVIILGDRKSQLQDTINILDLTKELKLETVTLRTKTSQ